MSLTRRSFLQGVVAGGAAWSAGCLEADEPTPSRTERQPAYHELEAKGELAERVDRAYRILEKCELCPRRCGVNRRKGQRGFCRASDKLMVYSHHPHFGEELPLVGRHGSGTLFFSHCNLRCVFCQNWPIAHEGRGQEVSDEGLAEMMLDLQRTGCHNINVVTPTHVMPHILNATRIALRKGLRLPLCYNTGGYERVEVIRLLDGIVDIYLPDLKYMDGEQADRYSAGAKDYPQMAQEAIVEMHRQVGDLVTDDDGTAIRGLMVRHLVMPNRVAGTREFVRWVAETLSKSTYVNIMPQYRVEHQAFDHPAIARALTAEEFVEAIEWAEQAGLTRLDNRSLAQRDVFRRRLGR
jgi:putative pyruvate formate lyase activating enzyme